MDTKRREDNEMESKIVLRKEIEMDRMVEAVQPCVLEQITNAVRSMTPNARIHRAPEAIRCNDELGICPMPEMEENDDD